MLWCPGPSLPSIRKVAIYEYFHFVICVQERDLIGLAGDQLCLFTADADVEEEVKISNKVLRTMGRVTVHSDMQVNIRIFCIK
jgi:hypothetical protein